MSISRKKFLQQSAFALAGACLPRSGLFAKSFIPLNTCDGDPKEFPFKFNPQQVFIGGDSAGGIIALGCAYYRTHTDLVSDQTLIDSSFPKATTSSPIKSVLGNMHTDYYYAPVDKQYWPTFAGVISLWGGFVIPKQLDGGNDNGRVEKGFFTYTTTGLQTYNPPLICFHGAKDDVIPFYEVPPDMTYRSQDYDLDSFSGTGQNYNSESLCTKDVDINCPPPTRDKTFAQQAIGGNHIELKLMSSLNLYHVMKQLDLFCELYVDCSAHHGLDNDNYTCGTCTSDPLNKF